MPLVPYAGAGGAGAGGIEPSALAGDSRDRRNARMGVVGNGGLFAFMMLLPLLVR
jgi:hypothetical protein